MTILYSDTFLAITTVVYFDTTFRKKASIGRDHSFKKLRREAALFFFFKELNSRCVGLCSIASQHMLQE